MKVKVRCTKKYYDLELKCIIEPTPEDKPIESDSSETGIFSTPSDVIVPDDNKEEVDTSTKIESSSDSGSEPTIIQPNAETVAILLRTQIEKNFLKLENNYLFSTIAKKVAEFQKNNPEKKYVVTFNEIDTMLAPLEHLKGGAGTAFVSYRRERSTFLTYLDRLSEETPNVIIIGTTNMGAKSANLDAATISRFSHIIELTYPDKDCLYEAIKSGLLKMKNIDDFIIGNDIQLKSLAETMANRRFSYRDLNSVLNESKMFYLNDIINNKDAQFKFEYLNKAQKNLRSSDGEREISSLTKALETKKNEN